MAKILTKKVKVQVRASQTLIFLALSQQKVKVWQSFTWTFTFLVGIFAILGEFGSFLCWAGPVPYLELFWAGPVKKLTLYLHPRNPSYQFGQMSSPFSQICMYFRTFSHYFACPYVFSLHFSPFICLYTISRFLQVFMWFYTFLQSVCEISSNHSCN